MDRTVVGELPEPALGQGSNESALTEAQLGLWYAQRLDPANPVFNTGQYLEILGRLDVTAFERAVNRASADADVLSMRVREVDGEPRLILDSTRFPRLRIIDVSREADGTAAAVAAMRADIRTPIDLSTDRIAAQWLFRIGEYHYFWYQRIHHVAIDGYGTALLVRRVCDEYAVETGSGATSIAGFGRWAEVVEAEREYRASPQAAKDRAFWHELFADRPDVPDLAHGPVRSDHLYLTESATLPASVDDVVSRLAASSGVVWPDVLVALTAAYLERHTGGTEAILGVPAMERLGRVAARVPGMVMNVLPVRVTIDEDVSLRLWLSDAAGRLQRARRHARFRGEQLRRDLGLLGGSRRLHGPLVNVLPFAEPPALPGLETSIHVLATGPVDDLTVTWRADGLGRGLRLEIDGNPRRYSAADLAAHANRLATFVGAAGEQACLADIPTVTPAEAIELVSAVNDTSHVVRDATLTRLIEETMANTPDAPALKFGNETWTYETLDSHSAALAKRLAAAGVGTGTIVGVCADRSFELVSSLVAVLRAGGAYLPIDPSLPAERVETMLTAAECRIVLVTEESRTRVPGERNRLVVTPVPPVAKESWAPVSIAMTDPAYVIFTSGSTGVPKGAVIEHRAIVNRLEWMREFYSFDSSDRFLQKTPASFDVSVWEFFLPLTTGALLVVSPPGAHRDPAWLSRLVRDERITTLHFVPSMLAVFLNEPDVRGLELRRVFCSGEELSAGIRDRFHQVVRAELHNLYGPTEAAVDVTYWPAGSDDTSNPVPIGFPVWNTAMYVLDERLRPVPAGVAGDLYIAGVQLGRGYAGRPDLTADRFVPNPFGEVGSRMYKTGDLARRRHDGAIVFLGRSDHQVKIRGFRIELDEIEAALAAAPGVGQAAVVVREPVSGEKQIVAYVVPRSDGTFSAGDWRAWLANRLPDYMIPSAFVPLDEFPLSPNGKLVRNLLPAPDLVTSSTGRAPTTDTEVALLVLFARALGVEPRDDGGNRFGIDDDFFALGGHSLLAARVMNGVRDRWAVDAGLGLLFAHPTVARLAKRIDELTASGDGHALSLEDYGIGPIIQLQEGPPARTPLFCIHPAGGLSWCYRTLARALQPKRTVFGLQARGLDIDSALPASLSEMATRYADEIRRLRPAGPYALLGWSVGGILAHAVAAELRSGGEEVGLLAMLDAYPADRWRDQPAPDENVALTALLQMAGHDSAAFPRAALNRDGVLAFLRRSGHPLGSLSDSVLTGIVRVVQHNSRLVREHHHALLDGPLLYFRAGVGHDDPALVPGDWKQYVAGTFAVHTVPYPHPELPSPAAVAHIAPVLGEWLDRVDDRAIGGHS